MGKNGLVTLGLDLGSNSVGSAWVDTGDKKICVGVSIFPAGIEERNDKRGAPKNQKRSASRSQRRSTRRRSMRKRLLRKALIKAGLLPLQAEDFDHNARQQSAWELRRDGLARELTPHEFGRVLVHLIQRRGASGIKIAAGAEKVASEKTKDRNSKDNGEKIKRAIEHLKKEMTDRNAKTFGQFMADLYDERKHIVLDENGKPKLDADERQIHYHDAIRNLHDLVLLHPDQALHADRDLIRKEFNTLWEKQQSFSDGINELLTDDLKQELDDPSENKTWRHRGLLFGQRRTYWNTGTLGRCDLEPTDHGCPHADRHAQEFRVLETVNNIRIEESGKSERPLTEGERTKVFKALRSQKTGSVDTVRKALGINKKNVKALYSLNLEKDPDREINTDWFYREVVLGVFSEEGWLKLSEQKRESVNRAVLKFDPEEKLHGDKLKDGAVKWWDLSRESADKLVKAWENRPKINKRLNLSRRAVQNLLPYMRACEPETDSWPGVTVARQLFAEDAENVATPEQRVRYAYNVTDSLRALLLRKVGDEESVKKLLRIRGTTKADRHFMKKHPDLLPPTPMLANPVVRKTIHEVRRHIIAYMRKFGRKPDRIVVEMASETRQSAKVRNAILDRNREREQIKKKIVEQHNLSGLSKNQQEKAITRVLLCRQQKFLCAYTADTTITEDMAASGTNVEVDHIVPKSVSWDNSLNNKVLCLTNANRGKGNRTPKIWLSEDQFNELQMRFSHFKNYKPQKDDYFGKKDYARKWSNLTRETAVVGEFRNSQLTDTAYAAKQITQWLRDVLYDGECDGRRRVFTTKGAYTAALRKDWQLQDNDGPKPRVDHRHHAIDAVVIALSGPAVLQELADKAAEQERLKDRLQNWPTREPVDAPWETVRKFRVQVMGAVEKILVSHRPAKRKIVGALHKETAYGEAEEYPGLYTFRMDVRKNPKDRLKPSNLRPPKKTESKSGKVTWSIEGRGQGSVVRNPGLCKAIRKCFIENGKDPDNFTDNDLKTLIDPNDYKLRFQSGVPIRKIIMVRTLKKPIEITGSDGVKRFYVGGNNHHMEILEDEKTGKWKGVCWDMFTVAGRVRPPKARLALPMVIGRELDRLRQEGLLPAKLENEIYKGKKFVMSLAEGEILYMKSPMAKIKRTKVKDVDYFVVVKIDEKKVYFTHHTDARPAQGRKNPRTGKTGDVRDMFDMSANQLHDAGPEPDKPPIKVRIDLFGNVRALCND